ncbi:MAG: hypothetical protein HETSPECPRED_005811 [Heterodermia speciosa]|uniref:Uncharacterized protein n=1 Tax=Heterodermia speciosa TaxID=116794 RepID=A0A8H3FG54_9LECA|nr:MAG: hypothetical protein HETSPECPRED_005811 [Heterodermia speciosa]
MSTVAIRRRTGSLLRPANQQSEGIPFDTSSPAIDLKAIARANWSSWRAHLRIAAIALCLVSIACIAWAYDHSPKGKIDHHVSDGQDVPWILLPLSLTTLISLFSLLLLFTPLSSLHPYATLPLDIFNLLTLSVVSLISTFGAIQTLQWTAAQYYNDANSGHDGYYIVNPKLGQPGEPRFVKVPPQNATVCSGWGGDCPAQRMFERTTSRRARVEVVGVGIAWGAV